MTLNRQNEKKEILRLLESQGENLVRLYREADILRRQHMGDEVFLRGIVEFSNVCSNDCLYCGIRVSNRTVRRYTMTADEIVALARELPARGQTTIVLQSGESPAFGDDALGAAIRRIKQETSLAVTLSVGNRPRSVYQHWKDCGMDRYLLRFETSDAALFHKLHPDCTLEERLQCLRDLRSVGVQVGSGFMIGLPGETIEMLAENILLCRDLDLDMIGIGPYIPHPDTPLGHAPNAYEGDKETLFRALAVLRLFNPDAHIPATTAFDAVFPGEGRNLALQRGANVFMPNTTPVELRNDYQLYPGKPCVDEEAGQCAACVLHRIEVLGRKPGTGPGHSLKQKRKG